MDGKVDIMKLMSNPNEEVQKHALLCVQKMMVGSLLLNTIEIYLLILSLPQVHNWEYLSKAN